MAIFRCNKCGHIREVGSDYIRKSVKCPKCDNSATIHNTVAFLNALIKKHITQMKELHKIRKELTNDNSDQETAENFSFEDIDIHKYLSLRKQLNIEKNQFVICVFGLSREQTQGMSSMYELTFVNENTLINHIQTAI